MFLEDYSTTKKILIRIFRTGVRTRGVNSQRCEVELRSAANIYHLPRLVASGRSILDHGNSIPVARIGGLLENVKSSPTAAAHLSLYT